VCEKDQFPGPTLDLGIGSVHQLPVIPVCMRLRTIDELLLYLRMIVLQAEALGPHTGEAYTGE